MIGFGAAVAAATLCAALLAALGLRRLPTVRLQLAGFALLAVVLPLTAVLLSGWVMFHMGDDVKILAVAVAAAGAAVAAALLLATSLTRRLERLRVSSHALASGDLSARAPEQGPRELADLGRSFNRMASGIEELFDARRELVASASHDLRTPVASIAAMLEAIEDGVAEPDEYLGDLRDQARRLASLVDDLFEVSRIDAAAVGPVLEPVEVVAIVDRCLRGLAAEAQIRGVRLERRGRGATALCAPRHLERVLLNLLTNALRHTPAGGTVAVAVDARAGAVEVRVEDTGVGLSEETRRRMFDRFWRGDASRTAATGGAGLGLTIARGLVEAQGGRIWADGNEAGGATVGFTLRAAAG